MSTPLRFLTVVIAAVVAGWAAFRFAERTGLEVASTARTELAGNQAKLSALEEENRRLSTANEDLRAKLNARTQSTASVEARAAATKAVAKPEPLPWELMRSINRDKSANVHLAPFDNNTGRLGEGFTELFALTVQERDALDRAVDAAHRELAALMVKNATAEIIDGKVKVTVHPFAEGAEVRARLVETLANTLGPDRFEVLNADIRNSNSTELNQAFGGFGVGGVAGTIIRVPTDDGNGSQFRVGLRIATTAGGSSSANNVNVPNPAALPESMRWLNILVPDLGNLPISAADKRASIAPGPGAMLKP